MCAAAFDKASKPSIGGASGAAVERKWCGSLTRSRLWGCAVAFSQKAVVVDHHSVRFELWDTAGQERFRSVNTLYYRGAAAGIVIYDITNRVSSRAQHARAKCRDFAHERVCVL